MTSINFDQPIDRKNTNCTKYDGMAATFGRTDVLPKIGRASCRERV